MSNTIFQAYQKKRRIDTHKEGFKWISFLLFEIIKEGGEEAIATVDRNKRSIGYSASKASSL